MSDTHTGSCFCGAIAIEAKGVPLEMGYCHCRSCRAYSGGPVSAFILWRSENVRVTRGEPLLGCFNKTGMSERTFCTKCGGHLIMLHPDLGLTDVRPATLPGLPFKPFVHLNYAEAVLRMRDGLLKLNDFPATAGGSGETLPD